MSRSSWRLAPLLALTLNGTCVWAQAPVNAGPMAAPSLADSLRGGWQTYIFVGTHMPRRSLVELAREAGLAGATLVLRGFDSPMGQPVDLVATQRLASEINRECCGAGKQPQAHWIVDPRLYDQYAVKVVPTFVVAAAGSTGQARVDVAYAKVAGDMALASALKFIAQASRDKSARAQASKLYRNAFGGTSQ